MKNIDPVIFLFIGIVIATTVVAMVFLRTESKTGVFKTWQNDLNIVTSKVLVSIFLAIIAVLTNLMMDLLGRDVNMDHVEATYWFIFGFAGIDAAMYLTKRATFKKPGPADPVAPEPVGERRTIIEERMPITQGAGIQGSSGVPPTPPMTTGSTQEGA